MNWHRNRLLRLVRSRPRLFIATAVAMAIAWLLPTSIASQPVTRWLFAWNAGAGLYVLLAAVMMIRSSSHHMRHRAQIQDDGQRTILGQWSSANASSPCARCCIGDSQSASRSPLRRIWSACSSRIESG